MDRLTVHGPGEAISMFEPAVSPWSSNPLVVGLTSWISFHETIYCSYFLFHISRPYDEIATVTSVVFILRLLGCP